MRCFNTEGICDPEEHYMVDVSGKASEIIQMIDQKKYFTINLARQYGKSNMLQKLEQLLSSRYYVISLSFQAAGTKEFSSEQEFVSYFMDLVQECMEENEFPDRLIFLWSSPSKADASWTNRPFSYLRRKIRELCKAADRPVVLMIDETDSASNNDVFVNFLGMLRENYLARQRRKEASFQSVILAGVTDVKNLKLKIGADGERRLNSPWNIAAEFKVDMSFSVDEISGMLQDYEADHHTGMDISAISREIRRLTSGYPYLVSWLSREETSKHIYEIVL